MQKISKAFLTVLTGLITNSTLAAENSNPPPSYEELFLQNAGQVELTPAEKKAIENYKTWESSGSRNVQTSYTGKDGSTIFTYGASVPQITCGLLQITDLQLQRGEVINSVNIGDSSRWSVEPAVEGSGNYAIQHVLIKPLDVGIQTNMLITTDRRSYRLQLKAKDNRNYLPLVSFVYPDESLAKFSQMQQQKQEEKARNSITTDDSGSKTYLGELNFNYEIVGDVSWKPLRVFDDGKKTIIEMPQSMLARNAPALMLLDHEGGLFSDEKVSIINYRLQGTRYVVDGLFDQAILTSGIDSDQQRVVIKRLGDR